MISNHYDECVKLLEDRGVYFHHIREVVYELQKPYIPNLNIDEIDPLIVKTLEKREVQNTILTGIALDVAAEKNIIGNDTLRDILMNDEGLYGVDEVLAYGICNIYGSIALTNFGYLDKVKPHIVGELNKHKKGVCNVFLDDIVAAIIASVASKLAHSQ